ncbi:MAG: polyribonucleotide nucleotidyltransferase [Clostridiales bacterium]|jgi:polyribonucleotide nucleotidyltransferase|nr:polyribonucleotide nucleotidyltransferase [Clostridiales bacterium]
MCKIYKTSISGKEIIFELDEVAELANSSVVVRYGDTVVLVAVTISENLRNGLDFFPLSVDYEEKLYSVGKIPGGFIRREGRPSEKAVLTSRLIDRSIRPLFDKKIRNNVLVTIEVWSVDQNCSPEIAAILGTSLALGISDISFSELISGMNVGLIDKKIILSPDSAQKEISDLNLVVTSTKNKVVMIEAGANEVNNDTMFEAINLAHEENKKIIKFLEKIVLECGKEKKNNSINKDVRSDIEDKISEDIRFLLSTEKIIKSIICESKKDRENNFNEILDYLIKQITERHDFSDEMDLKSLIERNLNDYKKEVIRKLILIEQRRPDGRKIDEIRELNAKINFLPKVHGSAIFKRGQTQVLTVVTLGSSSDKQIIDGIDLEEKKRYMHHYNFPSFSVGETRPSRAPNRREIGHGALAEKALIPVLPNEDEFAYVIRLVSEVLSSNGSTSQASICASSLALMDAGVPIRDHVAGISIGLIVDENNEDNFVMPVDIQGLEDFFGDMDFKVAGTKLGITAVQMDVKINGLKLEMIKIALDKAHVARNFIIENVMSECIKKYKDNISGNAPKIKKIVVDIDRLGDIIGPRGKTIKRIIDETGVDKIDTEDDGKIFIVSNDMDRVNHACEMIKKIITDPEINDVIFGKVTKITKFGAFVEIAPDKEGLIHVSKLLDSRILSVDDALKIGQKVKVKVINIDEQNRINLSLIR